MLRDLIPPPSYDEAINGSVPIEPPPAYENEPPLSFNSAKTEIKPDALLDAPLPVVQLQEVKPDLQLRERHPAVQLPEAQPVVRLQESPALAPRLPINNFVVAQNKSPVPASHNPCVEVGDCICGTTICSMIIGWRILGCCPSMAGKICDFFCSWPNVKVVDSCQHEGSCHKPSSELGNYAGCVGGIGFGLVGCGVATLFTPVVACTGAPRICKKYMQYTPLQMIDSCAFHDDGTPSPCPNPIPQRMI